MPKIDWKKYPHLDGWLVEDNETGEINNDSGEYLSLVIGAPDVVIDGNVSILEMEDLCRLMRDLREEARAESTTEQPRAEQSITE